MSISHPNSMKRKKLKEPRLNERLSVGTRFGDIAYLEAGQGPPAVFVHGVLLNADLWRLQLEELADLPRCLALPLPAPGGSAPGEVGLTISDQVDMTVDFLDALGLDSV